MNRRVFFRKLAVGVVGAAALASLPASLIKAAPGLAEPATYWAAERMTAAYHAWRRANPGKRPAAVIVGHDLFDLYERELPTIWRFTSGNPDLQGHRTLMFKGVIAVAQGRGYGVRVVEVLEWRRNTGVAA